MSDTIRLLLCYYLYGWLNGSLCSRINIWRKESRPMQRRLITSTSHGCDVQVSTHFWPHNAFQEKKLHMKELPLSSNRSEQVLIRQTNTLYLHFAVQFQFPFSSVWKTSARQFPSVCCIQEFTFGEEFKRQAESVERVWTDNTKTCKNFPSDY